MQLSEAIFKAESLIALVLQHQPNVLGTSALDDNQDAKKAAQAIATFRKELIAQLEQQP